MGNSDSKYDYPQYRPGTLQKGPVVKYSIKWSKKTVLPSRSVEPENQEDTDFRLVESQFLRMCRQHNVRPPTMRRQPGGMPPSVRPATGVPQAERTIIISKIDFITNPDLQMKFEAKKEEFKQRNIPHQTIFAFHGTQIQNIDGICRNNLNTINHAVHGHGYYFSEFPDVALGYGQGLLMFKVLPGNEYIGEQPNLHYGPNA